MASTINKIKRALALIILACFFLPLCQCSSSVPSKWHPDGAPPAGAAAPAKTTIDVFIPVAQVQSDILGGALLVLAFGWPLGFLAARRRTYTEKQELIMNIVETLLSAAASAYLVSIILVWGQIRYGGVIVLIALAAYFVAAGLVVGERLRGRMRNRSPA